MTVTVVGIVATVAYLALGDLNQGAKNQKLQSDADNLNRAVKVYLASGGSLDGADTVEEVLFRLKSAASSDSSYRLPGLSGSLIDPRLTVRKAKKSKATQIGTVESRNPNQLQQIQQTDQVAGDPVKQEPGSVAAGAEEASDKSVTWDPTTLSFVVGDSGGEVAEFYINEESTGTDEEPATIDREGAMLYAKESGWIWDYSDRSPITLPPGPTAIEVTAGAPDTTASPTSPPASPPPSTPSPTVSGPLAQPYVTVPGGSYSIRIYDLYVAAVNPNPPGSSKLVYAIDYGAWVDYSAPVNVPPGSVLSVQAIALTSDWSDSRKIDESYQAEPDLLTPPVIGTSRNTFGYLFGRTIAVSLTNPNPPGSSTLRYRLGDGPWQDYSGPFNLSRADYPSGVRIEAEAVPSSSPYWLASTVSDRVLTVAPLDLSSSTSGAFSTPIGSDQIVTNLTGTGVAESSLFQWGDVAVREGETRVMTQSSLDFNGLAIGAIQEGQRFQVGTLNYYNGTSYAFDAATGTISLAVTGVSFGMDVNLRADGVDLNTRFNFDFELVNVVNIEDPNDPWADADFVRVNRTLATERLQIDDRYYDFTLEFGETTDAGFATFNEFHVLEYAGADVKVYGTFSEVLFP